MEYFFPLHIPYFGTPLIGPKLVGFLVGRTITPIFIVVGLNPWIKNLDFYVFLAYIGSYEWSDRTAKLVRFGIGMNYEL